MKKILITGANSYIGTSFERYITENHPGEYIIDTVDMIGGGWREKSFAGYDTVFHVAGIAHQKETNENAQIYYEVNTNLAFEVAQKAKEEGVKQFLFLSSMSVYGKDTGVITKESVPAPKTHYGKSKWQAERAIASLQDEKFKICVLRPPMVYGKECKGNFQSLIKIVRKLPIFPYVKNKRSMIYIDNLSIFTKMCIDENLEGVHFPQNKEYMCTLEMAKIIAQSIGKKIRVEYLSGLMVRVLLTFHPKVRKAFGTLIYDIEEDFKMSAVDNDESIRKSV